MVTNLRLANRGQKNGSDLGWRGQILVKVVFCLVGPKGINEGVCNLGGVTSGRGSLWGVVICCSHFFGFLAVSLIKPPIATF